MDGFEIISVSNIDSAQISLAQNSFEEKFNLLALAGSVKGVNSFRGQEEAAEVLRKISALLKAVEDSRKAVKAPVLAIGKRIDETAKNFARELEAEKNRIGLALGEYAAELERRRRAAERKALEEAQARRRAAAALNPEAPAPEIVPVVREPARHKPAGTRTITTRRFEIIDEALLHSLHPELFVPDEAKVREFARGLKDISQPVDGLKVWDETKMSAF